MGPIRADLAQDDAGDGAAPYTQNTPALFPLLGLNSPFGRNGTDDKALCKALDKVLDRLLAPSPNLSVAHCRFVPVRPRNDPGPHANEEPDLSSTEYLSLEIDLLTDLLIQTLKLRGTEKDVDRSGGGAGEPPSGEPNNADIRARLIALDGLWGACLTGCLNAALDSVVLEQRQWWKRFQQSPPHRVARFQALPVPEAQAAHPAPQRYVRHKVDSVITDLSGLDQDWRILEEPLRVEREEDADHRQDRLVADIATGVRAFDTFIIAADGQFKAHEFDPRHRALITVATHRGIGKGTFLSAFSTYRGLSLYRRATWGNGRGVTLSGAIFVNLSFSPEIASVFDMLVEAIRREAVSLNHSSEPPDARPDRVPGAANGANGAKNRRGARPSTRSWKRNAAIPDWRGCAARSTPTAMPRPPRPARRISRAADTGGC